MSAHRLQRQTAKEEFEESLPDQPHQDYYQVTPVSDSEYTSEDPKPISHFYATSNLNGASQVEEMLENQPTDDEQIADHDSSQLRAMKAHDSGYISGSSQRNSVTDDKEMKMRPIYLPIPCNQDSSSDNEGSSSSSHYATAQTSPDSLSTDLVLEDSQYTKNVVGADSLEKKSSCSSPSLPSSSTETDENTISTQTSKLKDSCRNSKRDSCPSWKERRLSLDTKSASIDICPSCRNRLKPLPRRSSTELSISTNTLRLDAEKLSIQESQLGEEDEKKLRKAVQENPVDFRDCTDFTMLVMHLDTENLLHREEKEFLNSQCHTRTHKANRFYLEILPHKGPKAYRCLYSALKAEKEHKGHEHLVEILEQALQRKVSKK